MLVLAPDGKRKQSNFLKTGIEEAKKLKAQGTAYCALLLRHATTTRTLNCVLQLLLLATENWTGRRFLFFLQKNLIYNLRKAVVVQLSDV